MKSTFLFISLLCLFVYPSSATGDRPIFNISRTTITIGETFTVKCQFKLQNNLWPENGNHEVDIVRDKSNILHCIFSAQSSSLPRLWETNVNPHNYSDIIVHPMTVNLTTIEATIEPKALGTHLYACWYNKEYSTEMALTVVARPPSPAFSVNISKPQVGVPFTATCNIARFNLDADSVYSVAFYSNRDALLAKYEIENGSSLLSGKEHAHLSVEHGARTTYPLFDLILLETQDLTQEYWCVLTEPKYGVIESSHWGAHPLLSFSSSKGNAPNSRLGTCLLDNFQPKDAKYLVEFATDQGPERVNRLATYIIEPNSIPEFFSRDVSGWSEIVHGSAHAFPEFSIRATGNATLSGTWWCYLVLGTPGSGDYHEYNSEKVNLA